MSSEIVAFSKGIPSVFVVCSPFQALMAIEAIHEFEVKDYKFIVVKLPLEKDRINQLYNVLDLFHIKYDVVSIDGKLEIWKWFKILIPRINQYKRCFLGCFTLDVLHYISYLNISNNSSIVFLDDGNVTLSLFNGTYVKPKHLNHTIQKFANITRNIHNNKFLFTQYADATDIWDSNNNRFNIYKCNLHNINSIFHNAQPSSDVIFVGTSHTDYCRALGYSKEKYMHVFEEFLHNLSLKNKNVIYIPHGRDNDGNVKKMCDKYGISYIRPNGTIELYLLGKSSAPRKVYGFSSSALLNIHNLYPSTEVYNVVLSLKQDYPARNTHQYAKLELYLEEEGIKTIKI